jgi:DNA-binding NtrC family response regulator
MVQPLNVLILDDEEGIRTEIEEYLLEKKFRVFQASAPSEAFLLMEVERIDIILLDIRLPEMNGFEVLQRVKEDYPACEVIMISAHGDMESVIRAMRLGVIDFFNKPFLLRDLDRAIRKTQAYIQFQRRMMASGVDTDKDNEELTQYLGHSIVTESPQMKEVMRFMHNVASADHTTVLITGESGTGKELVAHGIHALSARRRHPFHSVNCASVPEELFESEFFGHTRGAFTGALTEKAGWFEVANKGTLFMDEIGDLKSASQPKFLRVLDDLSVTRLGSTKSVKVDVRVVAATNKSLERMVEERTFRPDLYYRLNSFTIQLPPLRERREDILPLFYHFLGKYTGIISKTIHAVDNQVPEWLLEQPYPGNIRELKHMVERAIILSHDGSLSLSHFIRPGRIAGRHLEAKGSLEIPTLHEIEKRSIIQALKKAKYVKSHAAVLLKISRQALDRKIEKFGIRVQWKK